MADDVVAADTLEETTDFADDDEPSAESKPQRAAPQPPGSPLRLAAICGLFICVALASLTGWHGMQAFQAQQDQRQLELFVQTARQAAVNLTTIDYAKADADVQRILQSATGTFYDDFALRSESFIDVVKKAQSKSMGTVTEAGLESVQGDTAQVLVAVSVQTTQPGAEQTQPRAWRMRMAVQLVDQSAKIAKVEFVP